MYHKIMASTERSALKMELKKAGLDQATIQEIFARIAPDAANPLKLKGEPLNIIKLNAQNEPEKIAEVDRNIVHEYGLLHQTSNALVVSPFGDVILQRRPHNKSHPKTLTIYGGHMGTLEDYQLGMEKEVKEELLRIPPEEINAYHLQGKSLLLGYNVNGKPGDKNYEYRATYVYMTSAEEFEKVLSYKDSLRTLKLYRSQKEFEAWLEKDAERDGFGEIWGIHFESLQDLLGKTVIHLNESFKDRHNNNDPVDLNQDTLLPLLNDPDSVEKIKKFIIKNAIVNINFDEIKEPIK